MKTGKRILVIDDDTAVRTTICENLRELDFEVLEASNGVHGLAVIEGHGYPDIIITDMIMPGMGGKETIEEIRKVQKNVIIIAISGGGRTEAEDFLESALAQGANAAFPKPVDLDKLEASVVRFMQ